MSSLEELRTNICWLEFKLAGADEITPVDMSDVLDILKDVVKEIAKLKGEIKNAV